MATNNDLESKYEDWPQAESLNMTTTVNPFMKTSSRNSWPHH